MFTGRTPSLAGTMQPFREQVKFGDASDCDGINWLTREALSIKILR
jgi:hypothetical protein